MAITLNQWVESFPNPQPAPTPKVPVIDLYHDIEIVVYEVGGQTYSAYIPVHWHPQSLQAHYYSLPGRDPRQRVVYTSYVGAFNHLARVRGLEEREPLLLA